MNYLGTIQTASGGTGINNSVTGPSGALPFRIQKDAQIYLAPDQTGMFWAFGAATTFRVGATQGAPLVGPNQMNGPYKAVGDTPTISVIGPIGGTVKVFGAR